MKETRTCSICGAEIKEDEALTEFQGKYYCSDCLDRETIICECCNERILFDDSVDGRVCHDCYVDHYCRCTECDALLHEADAHYYNDYPYCDNCYDNRSYEFIEDAQGFYDQKLYYEASQEIEKLVAEYTLPPMEEKKYDEKKTLIDVGIKSWKATSALQEVENLYNSGDYDLANTKISEIDTTLLTEERQQTYNDLQKKIEASRSLVEVEGYYNSGSYTSASNTLSGINTAYLTSEQNQKYGSLKEKIANAKAEAERKAENSTISYDKALELVKKYYRTYTTYNPPFYEKYDETASRWIIRAYEVISYPGELSHTSTFNIIGVDKKTGALYDEIVMETIIDDNGKYVANK